MQQKTLNPLEINNFDTSFSSLDAFLNYKILTISQYTLTPGILILVIVLVIISWTVTLIAKRVIVGKRKKQDNEFGRRFSFYMIIKYLIYVLTFITLLQLFGVSLNALLVGSAALLVGVGMGLQNIFSDLVSGLFLLFERPIEVGDVIEVDGIVGRIIDIKLRHTAILDRDGVNLIVPNHKFVAEKVVNWSHNKDERRFHVNVGVSYDSDPKQVTEILRQIALKHPFVIKKDEIFPVFVRFADFGDNSLQFQLFFWTRNTFVVENTKSELRYSIFEEFRKAGIQIPFPQRDVHIKSGQFIS